MPGALTLALRLREGQADREGHTQLRGEAPGQWGSSLDSAENPLWPGMQEGVKQEWLTL